MPHELVPGSGLHIKNVVPQDSEHVIEIENNAHNCHEFVRSPTLNRFTILSGLAVGMGGVAITYGDSERDMPWEQRYFDMFRENDKFFRAVSDLTTNDTVMRGVRIRLRVHNRRRLTYFDVPEIFSSAVEEVLTPLVLLVYPRRQRF